MGTLSLVRSITSSIKSAQRAITLWTGKVNELPAHYMRWADSIFQDAATIEVGCQCLNALGYNEEGVRMRDPNQCMDMDKFRVYIQKNAFCSVQRAGGSSSVSANQMDLAIAKAWANLVESIGVE